MALDAETAAVVAELRKLHESTLETNAKLLDAVTTLAAAVRQTQAMVREKAAASKQAAVNLRADLVPPRSGT